MLETKDYLDKWHKESGTKLKLDEWVELRLKCKTDLWFLAKNIFKLDLVESVHKPITDFFVKKNPNKELWQLVEEVKRLLLYPRGSFKSSIDIIDCVQWIICYPQVRILIITSVEDLAVSFVDELRNVFTLAEDAERTPFQELFPDHCVEPEKLARQDRFITPARPKYSRTPTIWAASILSSLPGWHCDVMKFDDAIIDKNSETEPLRTKVKNKITAIRKLLDPGRFIDFIGTRWHPGDYYGYLIEKGEYKYLCKPAWWIKFTSRLKKVDQLGEADYELLFPIDSAGVPRLSYAFLAAEQNDDPKSFAYQYLNDVREAAHLLFDLDLLRSKTRLPMSFPDRGPIYICWDWAESQTTGDYSVGVVARKDEQDNLYILDIVYGRFNMTELAFQIVNLSRLYQPQVITIEKSNGYEGLKLEVDRQALKYRVRMPIHWQKVDLSYDAKANRIKSLHPLLVAGRLWFASTIQGIDKVYDQFSKFTGERGKKRKDDIPDAVAFLQQFLPGTAMVRELSQQEKADREDARYQAYYKSLFPDDVQPEEIEIVEVTPPSNGLSDIFGGNGLG